MCAIILSRDTYKRKDGINLAGGRRFQAGLGSEHKRLYKEGQQINTLLLAQVIQVNYKYNTVDLLALQHKEVFQNSYANEGRFSARLPMEFGGRNLAGQPYGQVNPIAVGTVVLVGFINSDKDMPIVISVYNNNDVNKQLSRTRFANADPTDMTLAGEMYQKFSLYPSLTYDSIDGDGNRVVTFSGKSFIAFDTKDMRNSPMTDASYGSRYEDLGTSYYNDGELIEPMKGRAPNVLFKHQGILDDDNKPDTHNFMIHINPDGTYRTSMMDTEQDWRTMFEMTPEGKIRLRRQGDTVRLNDGFEIGELGINEEGIVYLRNGDMDLEVREDGIYSQGKLISESVNLDDIYEKLANATFEINKTNESLQILAGKSEVQDGKIVNLETEITIVAGKVESKVSATEVQDMIDSSIVDMAEAIKQAQEDADRANQIISDMASDNRLTPSEKLDLLKEWDIVKNEYPTYLAQAELYEVASTTYTAKYKALETFVTPLLEDMEATSVVDGSIMRKTFSAYYTERINLLNAITKGLKDGLEEAMKKASQASVDATQALADSAQAQIDANNAKQLIADIASDGKLTASEKYQLKKEWDVIVKEYPTTIAQATKYKVNTDNYTAKYKALETFVTPLFANMDETSVVNGEQLRTVFSDYYAVKITLLKSITDIARDELTDYGNRITVAETKITQTSEAITLMASRVETVESNVKTNTAQLKVQADLISQKVTASEVKDAIDNAIDNMSIGGSNLFVINTQTAGLLNENNGTVGTAVDKSVVSNYIKVTAKMPYVASLYGNTGTNSIIIAWYDTSKTFISGQAVADSGDFHKTYVAPENAVYARLSYKKSDTVKMKFEVGTKPTDYSPAWDDIKGDQTALEEYIKQVEEQAKQAQQEAENAKNEAENANSAIADMSNDNMLTANEKQQILLQWEEIKTEYPINLDQANKFNVSTTQYTTAYNALKSYLDPLLADITKTSVVIGSTMRSTFNTYYDRRTTLLNRVAELAKQVADQAKNTADKVDDDLNNIGGYNYIGFSSGDHMYPRLMIKNVGYYYIPSTTSAEFVGDMVCLKPKTATVTSVQYDVGNANASVADVGLANYRMKEVKTGQWLTASANLKVVGTGTAYLTIFTLENGSWKASYSDRVSASQGVTRVVAQRQVTDATTGILVRVDGSSITEVHFGNMQLEVGIRSTPWKKSDIDIQEDINNVADDIKDYIGARSDNLITNGFGELGNNTNIGGIFDGADRIVGKGSFRQEETNKSLLFSEPIVIDNKKVYNFDYYMHTLKGVGRSYAMICPYDVDGVRITYPSLGGRNYNSTTPVKFTKLVKPLKVGDTEVFVEDVSLWNGQAPQDYQRSIIMWGYKNSFGYTYPDGTYSQLIQMRTYDIGAVDTTANKITLNKPWAVANPNSSDGIFPVGHTLSPTSDGSTYLYLNGHVNIQVPTTYTKYSHLISGSSEFANTTIIPVETGFIQLGFLLNRDTTGEKSWLNGLRLRDYTDTYKLNDDVRETQENVDKAQQDANKANQSIADLSNDNLVTPNEKLDLKKEWEIIVAEKPKNDAQADKFGVSKVAYGTAYTALDTYLKPILASTTTNSAIVGQTMRDTFKAYYTARTDLLNAVATKAKDLADTAQSGVEQVKAKAEKAQADATKAQQDATKAQQDATKANQSIADLSNDNLVTPNEKLELKKEWEIIVAEKPKNDSQATKFGVSSTAYGTAYSALSTYLSPILTDLTTNSTIVGQTMRNTFTTYYSARTDLLNAVSTKAKELADKAQSDANNAGIKADNAQTSANKAQTDANTAQANANKAQSDANKANQSIADLSNDNLVTPSEKLDLKKEWEVIVAEKVINDAQADKFGVSKTDYGTKYTALSNYITPILTDLTTNSAIVGQTMRDTFRAYYTARTNLLNSISVKAKELADRAQTDANNAQNSANNAQSSANQAQADATNAQNSANKAQADATKANQSIADLSNDNLVTPNEKLDLKKEWEVIVAEKPKNDAQADKFGVSKTTYGTAYNALNTYLTPILANLTTNSAIVGQTMRDTFKTYYSARTDLLNAIASKAKDLADNAQDTADNIAVGTRNLLIGTQDFSKGRYPGNTHITITDEKLFGNAVMKNDFTTGTGYSDMYQLTTSIIPTGTQYTLSFYAKADIDKTKMSCYFYNPNTTVNSVNSQGGRSTSSDGRTVFVLSTEWTKYWVTWTQTQADRPKSVIIGRKTGGEEPNSAFYMSSPMLVEGNKPQTWMKAPEDIETAINGKEGAWVYSPTAPTNPAIGLVWVDSSKTPNQPKRWIGGETGWVALTPEEVKDLPWGEDGSNLADWVAQAEQKISSDAIINTVLGSEDFTGIFDKKANTEDLNNLASYDDLDAMQAEYERLLKEGIAGIDFSPYVTNTELEQLKDSFTFSVQQAGGVNMLKNSLGFSGLDFWDDDSGRNFYRKNNSVTVTNPNVKFERTADTPNGFKLTGAQDRNGTVRINNVINSNGYWTVSFWLRGSQSGTSNFQMDICDLGVTNFAVTADNDWRKVSLTVNVTNYSQSTYHFVDFQNIAWAYFFIKDFKVEKGITATDWTPAPEDAIVFDPIVTTTQNDQLAKLGFGSGFMVNRAQNAILRQTIELPEAKQGLQYALSFYMNVATFGDTTGLQCGARIYEEGVLKYTVGVTDATQGIPSDYHLYKLVFEPESPNTVIELFVINGAQATVIISGVMYNIGNIALKWQPYPSEIYNTNVKIDINGITVKNNQTDGYTMITPQEFSGYARVNGEMERIFTLNGQVTEVKMLKAEKRITMEPISVFAMNSKETNTIGWAFVASGDVSHTTVSNT